MTLAAVIGDFRRFTNPRQLMGWLGLVPRERSSGWTRAQGAITKAGNRRARRMLVESAWTYRLPPRVAGELLERSRAPRSGTGHRQEGTGAALQPLPADGAGWPAEKHRDRGHRPRTRRLHMGHRRPDRAGDDAGLTRTETGILRGARPQSHSTKLCSAGRGGRLEQPST